MLSGRHPPPTCDSMRAVCCQRRPLHLDGGERCWPAAVLMTLMGRPSFRHVRRGRSRPRRRRGALLDGAGCRWAMAASRQKGVRGDAQAEPLVARLHHIAEDDDEQKARRQVHAVREPADLRLLLLLLLPRFQAVLRFGPFGRSPRDTVWAPSFRPCAYWFARRGPVVRRRLHLVTMPPSSCVFSAWRWQAVARAVVHDGCAPGPAPQGPWACHGKAPRGRRLFAR